MTTTTTRPRDAVSVQELKRAWLAVQAGQFRRHHPEPDTTGPAGSDPTHTSCRSPTLGRAWEPTEAVLPVVGCAGSVGTSTVALALATAAATSTLPSRVVECCTVTASGLAAASTAELGQHPSGWLQGTRGRVLLERGSEIFLGPVEVPIPAGTPHPVSLTVLDVGWELGQLLAAPSWLADRLLRARRVVAVTTATIPGVRRLEGALALLDGVPVLAAVLGGPGRRTWPREVEHSMGALTRQLDRDGRLHQVPLDRGLANRGLDSLALPTPLLTAAGHLLHAVTETSNTPATTKGNPS
jgi:hypothetical protein